MNHEKTEGIVLRSLDYKDRQKIITLFSKEAGMISLILKGLTGRNTRLLALSSPFCQAEFIYRKGKSNLYTFIDGSTINENLHLRSQLSFLQTAGTLSKGILTSQLPGKPTPALYQLFSTYFKHISTFQDPTPLISSFYLKLLKHEGLLELSPLCAACAALSAHALHEGESYCHHHSPSGAAHFTEQEWAILLGLTHAQHFQQVRSIALSTKLTNFISDYFHLRLKYTEIT